MKKYIYIFIFALISFPFKSSAQLVVNSFSYSLSFTLNCSLSLEYALEVLPTSIASNNEYSIIVTPVSNGALQSSQAETIPIDIPINGVLNPQTYFLDNVDQGEYQVKLIEVGMVPLFIEHEVSTISVAPCQNANQQNVSNQTEGGVGFGTEALPIEIQNPISVNSIPQLIEKFLELLIKIGIPLLVVMIVYSGALYLFARGNPSKISAAHTMFVYTLIGGAILLGSWALAALIRDTFISITAFIPSLLV